MPFRTRAGPAAVSRLVVSLALGSACVSDPGAPPAESLAGPGAQDTPAQIAIDPSLPEGVREAWLGYALAKVAAMDDARQPDGQLDGPRVEIEGRRALASFWTEYRTDAPRDAYLDTLVDVARNGYLEEYVFAYFAQPGWTIRPTDIEQLDVDGFLDWGRQNLAGHGAQTLARVGTGPVPPAPGRNAEDPEAFLTPAGRPNCAMPEPLYRAAERWQEEAPGVFGQPLAAESGIDLLLTLRATELGSGLASTGATFVPGKLAVITYVAGYCAVERGEYDRALGYMQSAVSLRPIDPSPRLELAQILASLGRFEDTLEQVDIVLGLTQDPCDIARALRKRGYVEFEQGKLREAYKTYRESQTYEPDSPIARNELALLFDMMQQRGFEDLPPKAFSPPPTAQSANACTL